MQIACQSCRFNFKLDSNAVKTTGTLVRCSKCHTVFRVYPPELARYRRHTRVKTQNLISYFAFNKHRRLISHGLGIAVDISKGGILLETPYTIESSYLVLTAIDNLKNISKR
ncbi:MAG: zinc-ribbon domain-containing protein, partial [Deltaproteobacteria bacterium]|nr:zinc-ribbon domain-containing protein [Deltaproteobacteria bacterium]